MNLAYVHIIEGNTGEKRDVGRDFDYSKLREIFKNNYISNNCLDLETAKKLVNEDRADFVCFGRKFIANPDLVERYKKGAELNDLKEEGLYGGGEEGYTDYPFLSN